jgi:hypothetical protein
MLAVKHKEFGEGYAICFCERGERTFIVVDFGAEKKEFVYPDSFRDVLEAKDPEIQKQILGEIE